MNSSLQPSIRRGNPADLPAVFALLERAGLPTADLRRADHVQLWVSVVDAAVAGCIALERFVNDGLLRSLAVAADYRNRGLGRRLVDRLEEDARAEGVQKLALLTETAEDFFRTLGYISVDRSAVSEALKQSAEFRSLCPVSAVCMIKTLHLTSR